MPCDSAIEYYKRSVWYPLLDSMLSEMKERFNAQSKAVLQMSGLIPAKCVSADFSSISECQNTYGSFLDDGLLIGMSCRIRTMAS